MPCNIHTELQLLKQHCVGHPGRHNGLLAGKRRDN
jgi:hypothetical protein